jgi:peptide/nickel transport system ATP-binding protein
MSAPLLQLDDLHVAFNTPFGFSHALRGVTFAVQPQEIFGLVGESGCGKSMTGRAVMGLLPQGGRLTVGRMDFDGHELATPAGGNWQQVRGKRIAMIFQNPGAALNPVFRLGRQMDAILKQHGMRSAAQRKARTLELLADVGLPDPAGLLDAYPHQLSGGMQQRAMIAMALSSEPELLIADEPTTALDVTIQAQILDLLVRLRDEHKLTILLITHDMGVVAETCDRVAVLYAGRVVEEGPVRAVLAAPEHPYTRGLMAALPAPDNRDGELAVIPGSVPGGLARLDGCAFAPRCDRAMAVCTDHRPHDATVGPGHRAACFLHEDAYGPDIPREVTP